MDTPPRLTHEQTRKVRDTIQSTLGYLIRLKERAQAVCLPAIR